MQYGTGGSLAFTGTGITMFGQNVGTPLLTSIGAVIILVGMALLFTARRRAK